MISPNTLLAGLPWKWLGLMVAIGVWGCGGNGSEESDARPRAASHLCSIERLTSSGFTPSISADGVQVAFASLTAQDQDNNTFRLFVLNTITKTLTSLVSFTQTARLGTQVMISANGSRVAFTSAGNPTGTNADGNPEVFLFDILTNTLLQITNTTTGSSFFSAINADGTRIAFVSSADPTGGNPDGNNEIFLADVGSGTITQITNTQSSSTTRIFFANSAPSIDASGTRISFVSDLDLTGGNPDSNIEVFLFHTLTNTLTQITNLQSTETVAANIFSPTISADGNRIVFETTANVTGQNADNNPEIFLFDIPTNTFSQLTHTGAGRNDFPVVNTNGTRVAFEFEKKQSFLSEILLFDTATGSLITVTDSGKKGTSNSPSISADGTRIAFGFAPEVILVGADLLGFNAANPAQTRANSSSGIFLATCRLP